MKYFVASMRVKNYPVLGETHRLKEAFFGFYDCASAAGECARLFANAGIGSVIGIPLGSLKILKSSKPALGGVRLRTRVGPLDGTP